MVFGCDCSKVKRFLLFSLISESYKRFNYLETNGFTMKMTK